jgi:hypothetical protein
LDHAEPRDGEFELHFDFVHEGGGGGHDDGVEVSGLCPGCW